MKYYGDHILSWLVRNYSLPGEKMPIEEIPISNFWNDLQMVFSMQAIVLGERSDKLVSHYQVFIAYAITHPMMHFIFNWAKFISRTIAEQLKKLPQTRVFTFVSHIVWLLLFQNHEKFSRILVHMKDQVGLTLPIDEWTNMLKASNSYYNFVNHFLGSTLSLVSGRVLPRLSIQALATLRTKSLEKDDWYFTHRSIVIRLYGFGGRLVLLPFYVTIMSPFFRLLFVHRCDMEYGLSFVNFYLSVQF